MLQEMSYEEAEQRVISLLRSRGPLTTRQIEKIIKAQGAKCPNSPVRFLSKLWLLGKIHGEVSAKRRAWVWWVEDKNDCE
jgi:DUF1365 family protein